VHRDVRRRVTRDRRSAKPGDTAAYARAVTPG
jgi:hypothetical protein